MDGGRDAERPDGHAAPPPEDKFERIFLVGVGRSGTSLLQSMLAAHPEIASAPETSFIRRYMLPHRLRKLRQGGKLEQAIEILNQDKKLSRLAVSVSSRLPLVWRDKEPEKALYEDFTKAQRELAGGRFFLDKDPKLIECLPLIHHHWPAAYIIHIIRDPRDVLASKKSAAWSMGRPMLWHVLAGRLQYDLGRETGRRLFGDRYIEVSFERLVTEPAEELSRLTARLEIPYDENLLNFADAARSLVSEDEMSWKKETLGPLKPGNVNKWKSILTPWGVCLCELACGATFEGHGYETSEKPGSGGQRMLAYALLPLVMLLETAYLMVIRFRLMQHGISLR